MEEINLTEKRIPIKDKTFADLVNTSQQIQALEKQTQALISIQSSLLNAVLEPHNVEEYQIKQLDTDTKEIVLIKK